MNSTQDVFLFHSVTRAGGFNFTVTSSFTVRTTAHQESECNSISEHHFLCCDVNAENQLSISPEKYSFGVTIVNNDVRPYVFKNNTEFVAKQFQAGVGTTIPAGTSYPMAASAEVSDGLLLMRLIGKISSYIYMRIIMHVCV